VRLTQIDFTIDEGERIKLENRLEHIETILNSVDYYIDGSGAVVREPKMSDLFSFLKSDSHKLRLTELALEVNDIRLRLFGGWVNIWRLNLSKLNNALSEIKDSQEACFRTSKDRAVNFELYFSPDNYHLLNDERRGEVSFPIGELDLKVEGHFYPDLGPENKLLRTNPPKIVVTLALHFGGEVDDISKLLICNAERAKIFFLKEPQKTLATGWDNIKGLYYAKSET
jgi:hypothetical protein